MIPEKSDILSDLKGGVFTITLNRPEKLNAMRLHDFKRLLSLVQEFRDNSEAQVLILTAKGRAFCAGEDLHELLEPGEDELAAIRHRITKLQSITELLYVIDKPIIAAINGIAVGFGVEVTLACDIRIASDNTYFWFAEATRGLLPANGAFYLLPRLVGQAYAAQMMLAAEKVNAEDALDIGLISEVTTQAELMLRAEEIAHNLIKSSRPALSMIKKMLRETSTMDLAQVLELEIEGTVELAKQGEILAGVKRFKERKKKLAPSNKA